MAKCGRCGEDNPERARFCLACGSALAGSGPKARKTITVLFADMVDSTGLGERLDPEALQTVMGAYFGLARKAIEAHGGTVEKFVGDAVMAVFGIPQVHEDDALRAVRAAVEILKEVAQFNQERPGADPIAIRIGINTGKVIAALSGAADTGIVGDAVNSAARLEKLAKPHGIVIGASTYKLVRGAISSEPLGPVMVKGKEQPLEAYVVLAVDPLSSQPRTFEARMVGRKRELEALERAFERVAEDRTCILFTLLGPAGIGKSRLINELTTGSAVVPRVLGGRCLPYGDGITFWPIAEVISAAAHISDRDSQEDALIKLSKLVAGAEDDKLIANLVGQLMGLGEQTAGQEEMFWAVRKVFERLSNRGPLLLVFDDIHWAEDTLLDLIDHVVDWSNDSPILVACLARPELLESRPNWAGGKLNSTTILLEPFREAESKELFTGLLGDTSAIDPLLPRIIEVSGGNPFFLEETVAMLVDEGVIEKTDGRWVANTAIDKIAIPPTINALLTSRLDQLPAPERTAIELAAVMGKVFASEAVRELATNTKDVKNALVALCRKGLLRLDQEEFAGEEMYQFRHILIRDATYQIIPKERRAALHERYADWLIAVLGDRSSEYEEIIGYHYEQAHRYAAALGIDASQRLALRAGASLAEAGRRAFGRSDLAAAVNLLTRAVNLYPEHHEQRSYLLLELGQALLVEGEYSRSESYFEEALACAAKNGDVVAETRARLHLEEVHVHNRPQASTKDFRAAIEGFIPTFQSLGDDEGLAFAYRQLSYACDSLGDSTGSARALSKAVEHAVAAGDERAESTYRRAQIQSLSWGPTRVAVVEERALAFLEWAEQNQERRSVAMAYGILAPIEASKGNFEVARNLIQKEFDIYVDLGLEVSRAWSMFEHVTVETLAGTIERSEIELERACEVLRRREETAVLPTVLGMLADVRVHQGALEEAEALVDEALRAAAEDDILTIVKCRSVQAKVRAKQGREEEAFSLSREATRLADTTEWLDWRAFTWLDRASVAQRFGRENEAEAAIATACELFRQKGMEHAAVHAVQLLTNLT